MNYQVKVGIICFVDDSQPGWVECRLIDAWQREWIFAEKVPVVTSEHLDLESNYPTQGFTDCLVISRRVVDTQEVITIDTNTPWFINSICGETSFDVLPEKLSSLVISSE